MAQILLIEDRPNQRQLYEDELRDEGFEVFSASNGHEGLELFDRHHIDAVIVDILLPGMNGIEVMEKLLARNPQLPIIVHSAYSSPSHDFITWFARSYVMKSGDLKPLVNEVKQALAATAAVQTA